MIQLGTTKEQLPYNITTEQLTNHAVIFGMSGSGKTGQLISMVEQVILDKVPVLLVDIKGDLANLVQSPDMREKAVFSVVTPGARHGNSVDMFAKLTSPEIGPMMVTNLLDLIGVGSSRTKDSYHAYVTQLIKHHFEPNERISLEELLDAILDPQITHLGMLELDRVISSKSREELALKLNNIIATETFDLWRLGLVLDFDYLFAPHEGKTSVVIYSVAHIVDESERNAALSTVFYEYLHWTMQQSGSKELRSMIVVDECHGIMPPHPRNPVTKYPLLALLKQARAFGNGVLLATQNPKDIDYKGLANCGLWISGKLQTKHDRDRVIEGILAASSQDKKVLEKRLGTLQKREFLVAASGDLSILRSRDTVSPLSGPLSPADMSVLSDMGYYYVAPIEVNEDECIRQYRKTGFIGWLKKIVKESSK